MIKSNKTSERLTLEWQKRNNIGYEDLLKYYEEQNTKSFINIYDNLEKYLSYYKLNNGLIKKDNEPLFETPYIEEALYLVIKGLKAIKLKS